MRAQKKIRVACPPAVQICCMLERLGLEGLVALLLQLLRLQIHTHSPSTDVYTNPGKRGGF